MVFGLATWLFGLLLVHGTTLTGQEAVSPASPGKAETVSLADVARNLPEYSKPGTELAFSQAFENATSEERDAALPTLMSWINDDRPEVRRHALLSLSFLYMPSATSQVIPCRRYLPMEDVRPVAEHLRDADWRARNVTFLALGSVEACGHGLDVLIGLVLPMLRNPEILTEYPDPFFIESEQRMLARMTPQQREAYKSQPPRPVIKLPAEGPILLSILAAPTRKPSAQADDAMVAFLDRPDQTKSTIAECVHTLALSHASERVNDAALRRVFELKAMSVYILQFVGRMRLTPAQLAVQKERLLALSNDESAYPEVRKAAGKVVACWTGESSSACPPLIEEMNRENNRTTEQR
jgi:hypothetical protein